MSFNGDKLIQLNCGRCQTAYRVHTPGMTRLVHPGLAQVSLFALWSIEERVCPSCKALNVPCFGNVQIGWTVLETEAKQQEQSRIIVPSLVPPHV